MPRPPGEGHAVTPLQVAVVGTGTAGSAAALFLARLGHAVTVFERVPEPSTVGAGIMLQPTGMAVLRALGLEEPVVRRGDPVDRLWVQTAAGKKVMDLEYAQLDSRWVGLGLHRGVLFEVLYRAALAEPGVTVRTGLDVEDLAPGPRGRLFVVERQTRAKHGPFDLVVVGNGARSSLRDDTPDAKQVSRYPWGALWAVVPDAAHEFRGRLFQVVRGTRRLIGLMPTGLGPRGDTHHVSFFFSLRADQLDAWRAGDFEAWKAGVLADVPSSAPVLQQLEGPGDLLFSEYHDIVMWPWNTDRVVYLGDAAHAMSPQLGQGANLALLDAWTLGEVLRDAPSVPDALYAYSRRRRWHLGWYQLITRWLTPFFQSDHGWLAPLRDVGLGGAAELAWVRRQMVSAMAGVSRGPGLALLPLPGEWDEPRR